MRKGIEIKLKGSIVNRMAWKKGEPWVRKYDLTIWSDAADDTKIKFVIDWIEAFCKPGLTSGIKVFERSNESSIKELFTKIDDLKKKYLSDKKN